VNVYTIDDMSEIANAIKSGEPVENDIGSVADGFFWFPDEMQWAMEWQKENKADSPHTYFAMLLDPDVFKDEEDDEEIKAGIEYWWHRSQIYSAAYLINNMPKILSNHSEDISNESLKQLLKMQKEVKKAFDKQGFVTSGPGAKPKDIWQLVRATAQYIHNSVRGVH
tara:strand:+ start:138 stop:638 length:501 start_codon:yes stop_codon:yes gene_type:complete